MREEEVMREGVDRQPAPVLPQQLSYGFQPVIALWRTFGLIFLGRGPQKQTLILEVLVGTLSVAVWGADIQTGSQHEHIHE